MPYTEDKQIAGLDAAAALTGAEIAALSQGGATVRETLANIRTFYEKRALAGAKALALLAGEEGMALDFLGRSAAVRDYAQSKNFLGRPEDLLTVSRASTAAYIDRDRILKYAGTGVLRYDHDPSSGAPLGALIEGSRTNNLQRSEEFDNAYWTKTNMLGFGSGSTANATNAPDNAATAELLTPNTTNGEHHIRRVVTATVAQSWALSVYVKSNGYPRLRLRLFDNGATGNVIQGVFNTDLGTVTSVSNSGAASGAAGRLVTLANGWFRLELSGQPNTSGTDLLVSIDIANASGTLSFAGDGTSGTYLWGAQLEVGAFASSYIPTTSGTVTRSADDVSMAYSLLPASVGSNEATLFADVDFPNYAADITKALISLEVSGSERLSIMINSAEALDGQVVSTSDSASGIAAPTIATRLTKAALGVRANDAALSAGGTGGTTVDTSITMPVGTYANLFIGSRGGNQPYGYIRKAAYFPRRLTATELNALTA